jgi:hypothetical protein
MCVTYHARLLLLDMTTAICCCFEIQTYRLHVAFLCISKYSSHQLFLHVVNPYLCLQWYPIFTAYRISVSIVILYFNCWRVRWKTEKAELWDEYQQPFIEFKVPKLCYFSLNIQRIGIKSVVQVHYKFWYVLLNKMSRFNLNIKCICGNSNTVWLTN